MSKEHAYAYEAGYRDGLKEALVENAKLRREFELDKFRGAGEIDHTAKLRDEFRKMDERHSKELIAAMGVIAKLRELVKYTYECAIHSDHATCDDCKRMNGCCILVDRMRELKIEVGE